MMPVLLLVCMLRVRECDGNRNTGVVAGRCVVVVSVGCKYMAGTHGSGFVSTANTIPEMSVG